MKDNIGVICLVFVMTIASIYTAFRSSEIRDDTHDMLLLERAKVLYNMNTTGKPVDDSEGIPIHDYNIDVTFDTAYIYDGYNDKYIGKCDFDSIPQFIMKDNE